MVDNTIPVAYYNLDMTAYHVPRRWIGLLKSWDGAYVSNYRGAFLERDQLDSLTDEEAPPRWLNLLGPKDRNTLNEIANWWHQQTRDYVSPFILFIGIDDHNVMTPSEQ